MATLDRQRQEQVQMVENEMEYRQAIIEERDDGIEAIQHSIGEVNEIFQDLAILIDQQGGQIGELDFSNRHTPYIHSVLWKMQFCFFECLFDKSSLFASPDIYI